MKTRLTLFLGAVLLGSRLIAADATVGMSEEELLKAKGEPQATLKAGDRAIYRWPDVVVNVVNGKVVLVTPRDLPQEQAEQNRRAQLAAEIENKAALAKQQQDEEDKKRAAEEERLRPQREMAELKEKVAKLEQEKSEQAAALQKQVDDLQRARAVQIQNLQQAIDTSGYYYRKARDAGEKEKAATLLRVLLNQQAELSALTGEPIH